MAPIRCAPVLFLAWLLILGARPLLAQQPSLQMQAVGATSRTVMVGSTVRLEVRLTRAGQPAVQVPVIFTTITSPGGVSLSPNPRISDSLGFAFTDATLANPGSVRIDATADGANSVSFFLTVEAGSPPAGTPSRLERITPEQLTLVVGDRQTFEVRVLDAANRPASGISLTWTVESSPGSPRSVGVTTPSDANGVATGNFGFSVPGNTVLSASFGNLTPVRFRIETRSLGELAPPRRSFQSLARAMDAICQEVFSTPVPEPTPLCVYMTGTLQTRLERGQAIRELTAGGLGAQGQVVLETAQAQAAAVASRLSALRMGAARGALSSIAFSLDGQEVLSSQTLVSAWSWASQKIELEHKLDRALAQVWDDLSTVAAEGPGGGEGQGLRERPWGFFVTGRWIRGDRAEGFEEPSFRLESRAVTLGFDRALGANDFLGVAFSGNQAESALRGASGALDLTAYSVTAYGIWEGQRNGYLQLGTSYGQGQFEQRRRLDLPRIGALQARADFDGSQYGGFLEAGWAWEGRRATATLFGRSSYLRATIDGFTERGARATIPGTAFGEVDFGLEVEEQSVTSWLGEVGFDLSGVVAFPGGVFIPQLNATYVQEFKDDGHGTRGRFLADTAAAASFELFTDDPDRKYFNVGASLRFQFLWGSFFVAYDQEFERDDLELRTVNAGLRFEF